MDKNAFIKHYKRVLNGNSKEGIQIILEYIVEQGNDYHKEHITDFLQHIAFIPPLYNHCLQRAIDYFVDKFSIVVVTKQDPNASMMNTQVVTIY